MYCNEAYGYAVAFNKYIVWLCKNKIFIWMYFRKSNIFLAKTTGISLKP